MVIGIHTSIGCGFDTFHEYFNTALRQVLNCAVPVFIACSGFFLASKDLNTRDKIINFYKKQISRVYIPCLLWSFPWLVIYLWGGNSYLSGLLNLFFCGFSVFYFVILMIQYYLLLPIIQTIHNKWEKSLLISSIICSLICVAFVVYIRVFKAIQIPLTMYAGPFPLWIMFFVLGVVLAANKRDYKLGYIIIGVIITLIFQIIESKWLVSLSMNNIGFGIKPSSFLFSLLTITLLFSAKFEELYRASIIPKAIAFIGRISFVVYLSHTLIIQVLHLIIPAFNNMLWGGRFLFVGIFDILLVISLYYIIPQKLKRFIGF